MRSFLYVLLTTGLATSAAVTRRGGLARCCFSLIAQGPVNGPVGEDSTGENSLNGTLALPGAYCFCNAILTNSNGHPCTILSSTGQFVCENSAPTNSSFTLANNGNLLHDGSPNYFACPAAGPGNDESFNLFSEKIANLTSCTNITIITGGFSCAALGKPSSPTITPTATPTAIPTSASSTYSCPTDVSSGSYIAPNLIIPVSSAVPHKAFGTQYIATITPNISTVFAFDIPTSYTGTCALIFQFPSGNSSQFPYTFSTQGKDAAPGGLAFALLSGPIDNATTFDSLPQLEAGYGTVEMLPGNNYTIATGPCRSGQRVSYEVSSVNEVVLQYFQTVGSCPIGAFVVSCA